MISNSSPLIFLSKIGKLELLKELFKNIKTTSIVKDEIFVENKTEVQAIKIAIEEGWIIIEDPKKELYLNLGKGEQTAISLAIENKSSLIIDDALVVRAARSFNIEIFRTTSVILLALDKKLISKKEALDLINKLIERGYYISPFYYTLIADKLK